MDKKYDVYGLGNALVDFLVEVSDNIVTDLNLTKGQFHLSTEEQSRKILEKIRHAKMSVCPGGSCANAIATIAMLGGKTAFCSKVGNDEYGKLFVDQTRSVGVEPKLKTNDQLTGNCIVLVTPDAERTFAVNLGASLSLEKNEIEEEHIKSSSIIHVDGYQIEQAKDLCVHAIELAQKNNVKISIDLSDPGVVLRNKETFIDLVKRFATIVFANEEEVKNLTGKDVDSAIEEMGSWCDIVVVKLGSKGSVIKTPTEKVTINAVMTTAVDTTGAGDCYAAGILYGLTNNLSIKESGELASRLGSKVVEQIGARLKKEDVEKLR